MAERIFLSSPHMGGAERRFVAQVFESNWIAPAGPMVTEFEGALCRLTGLAHVAALSSGTAALQLALRLAELAPGDEVWCPTMTFIGGVAPISYAGANPVFIDIDADQLLMDSDLLEEALQTRSRSRGKMPRAVMTTDLYGQIPDMARMARLREEFGFLWISDSAEAVGSRRDGRHAGKGADFAIYSFNGNKIITTSGGGALASDNAAWIEQARFLSTQAKDPAPHYEHSVLGYNYRLSSVCAAIGMGQLLVLEDRVAARRRIHGWYRRRLAEIPGLAFSCEPPGSAGNRWLTTILVDPALAGFTADQVRIALDSQDIESRPLWKPMHMQPVFRDALRIGGTTAEAAFRSGLCLPSGSQMIEGDVGRICDVICNLAKTATPS